MEFITVEGVEVQLDMIGRPVVTETGVRCGECSRRHASAKAVRFCFIVAADERAAIEDEIRAEASVERFFEERGYEEARAQEAYEMSRGIYAY